MTTVVNVPEPTASADAPGLRTTDPIDEQAETQTLILPVEATGIENARTAIPEEDVIAEGNVIGTEETVAPRAEIPAAMMMTAPITDETAILMMIADVEVEMVEEMEVGTGVETDATILLLNKPAVPPRPPQRRENPRLI